MRTPIQKLPLTLFVLALSAALLSALAPSGLPGAPALAEARVGGRPPAFILPAAAGGPTSGRFSMRDALSAHQPVVILFWATWCQPCMQELPFYQSMYERYRAQGLRVVAISMDSQSTLSQVGPAARRLGLSFDVVTDVDSRVTTQLNPRRGAPFSVYVGRDGRIVRESEGFAPAETPALSRAVAELVGQ